ncbi:tyrosine phosphatase [Coniochaeta sp. 2T2.1]|nr:tyrosine phosphatase [Coniochaeta sp. 2T2.1]
MAAIASRQPELEPPFIAVPALPNLRDIGGQPVQRQVDAEGEQPQQGKKIIRPGIVFRSAEPSKVSEEGVSMLTKDLGITHVFDLRSKVEIHRAREQTSAADWKPREWPGSKRVFVPVFLDQDYSPEALAVRFGQYSHHSSEGFVKAYSSILTAAADPEHPYAPFTTILNHLAGPDPSPMLIHCTAGKDRTGVICALILSLCGVDDETVAAEYELTQRGLAARKDEFVAHVLDVAEKMNIESIKGNPEAAERMTGARKDSMLATLTMIREKYGSVESYVMEQCRVTRPSVEQIRRNLVVTVE